jgi:hypothetical protein
MRSRHLSRSQRRARRQMRWLTTGAWSVFASACIAVYLLSPRTQEQPVVTVFIAPGCDECLRWMRYLSRHGFRPVAAEAASRTFTERQLRLPPGFISPILAIVNGLGLSGLVPAREIHRLVKGRLGRNVVGVAAQGGSMPPPATNTGP